ncbi:hypothetical protein [uncultured Chryseobacterium sp.]|uniref:hypothetical protein n=2 Tax=uncultured Chryseobacterium sp. TaxID=259322 RepID=UPI0025DC61DB|nr:hypothetical protein [uncultured Chryseobacterium sp.]
MQEFSNLYIKKEKILNQSQGPLFYGKPHLPVNKFVILVKTLIMATSKEQIEFLKSYRDKFSKSEKSAYANLEYVGFIQTLKEIYSDNTYAYLLLRYHNAVTANFSKNKPEILEIMDSAILHYQEMP